MVASVVGDESGLGELGTADDRGSKVTFIPLNRPLLHIHAAQPVDGVEHGHAAGVG